MKNVQISVRIDNELNQALEEEASRRNQGIRDLIRTFLRDGLARYDSYSEQIMESQLAILEQLKKLQEMMGAALHLHVEQTVLGLRQGPNETADEYKVRLQGEYRKAVYDALGKGGRIASVAVPRTTTAKVSHDH